MAEDLATLGLRVDGRGYITTVKEATTETRALKTAGQQTEQQYGALDQQLKKVQRDQQAVNQTLGQGVAVQRETARVVQTTANATRALGQSAVSAEAGAARLRGGLAALAGQATGANPALVQVVSTIGMLGAGSVVVSAVLLGVAAIGGAYRKLTEDTREAREEQERLIAKLKDAAEARVAASAAGLGRSVGVIRSDLEAALAERTRRQQTMAEWEVSGPLSSVLGLGLINRAYDARKLREAEQVVADLTKALYEQTRALDQQEKAIRERNEAWKADQTLAVIEFTVTSTERMREATRAAEEFTRSLARLNAEAARLHAATPNATTILSGVLNVGVRDMSGPGPQGVNPQARYSIALPPMSQIQTRTTNPTGVQQGTDWGRYATAAQIGGGVILGSGLAGDGYKAAALGGALNGAATGAMLGSVVPGIGTAVGAVIGGVAGLVSGLLGQSKRAREEAKALAAAQKVFDANLKVRQAEVAGETERAAQLRLAAQHEKELADARASGMSKASVRTLQAIQAEEKLALVRDQAAAAAAEAAAVIERQAQAERELAAAREQALQRQEDILVQMFSALGMGSDAARAGLQFERRRALAGAAPEDRELVTVLYDIRQGLLERDLAIQEVEEAARAQLTAIDRQLQLEQEALRVAEDQLRTQQQTVDSMRRVVESLASYSDSMRLGSLSPLTPTQQLNEARRQVGMLENLARGGDASAAASLPAAVRQLLEYQSKYSGTATPEYQAEFARAQKLIEDVRNQFANQVTAEEKILAELQKQTTQHQTQIQRLNDARAAVEAGAANQIKAIKDAWELEKAQWTATISRLSDQVNYLLKIEQQATDIEKHTNKQKQILEGQIKEYQTKVIPDLIGMYGDLLNAKDIAYAKQLADLVAEYNKLLFGGGRAAGGPVAASTAYLVGERGPEIFVPAQSGTIIPNGASMGSDPAVAQLVNRIDGLLTRLDSGPRIMAAGFEQQIEATRSVEHALVAKLDRIELALENVGA